jgi:hypothetical protein
MASMCVTALRRPRGGSVGGYSGIEISRPTVYKYTLSERVQPVRMTLPPPSTTTSTCQSMSTKAGRRRPGLTSVQDHLRPAEDALDLLAGYPPETSVKRVFKSWPRVKTIRSTQPGGGRPARRSCIHGLTSLPRHDSGNVQPTLFAFARVGHIARSSREELLPLCAALHDCYSRLANAYTAKCSTSRWAGACRTVHPPHHSTRSRKTSSSASANRSGEIRASAPRSTSIKRLPAPNSGAPVPASIRRQR